MCLVLLWASRYRACIEYPISVSKCLRCRNLKCSLSYSQSSCPPQHLRVELNKNSVGFVKIMLSKEHPIMLLIRPGSKITFINLNHFPSPFDACQSFISSGNEYLYLSPVTAVSAMASAHSNLARRAFISSASCPLNKYDESAYVRKSCLSLAKPSSVNPLI